MGDQLRLGDQDGADGTACRQFTLFALKFGFLSSRDDIGHRVIAFDRCLGAPIPFGPAGWKIGGFFVDAGQFINGGQTPVAMPAKTKGLNIFDGFFVGQTAGQFLGRTTIHQ